MDLTT